MKKMWQLVHVCRTYHKNKSGKYFLRHGVKTLDNVFNRLRSPRPTELLYQIARHAIAPNIKQNSNRGDCFDEFWLSISRRTRCAHYVHMRRYVVGLCTWMIWTLLLRHLRHRRRRRRYRPHRRQHQRLRCSDSASAALVAIATTAPSAARSIRRPTCRSVSSAGLDSFPSVWRL